MSKIADAMIQIEDMLRAGHDINTVAQVVGVPVDWVISVDLELSGMNDDQGYGEE